MQHCYFWNYSNLFYKYDNKIVNLLDSVETILHQSFPWTRATREPLILPDTPSPLLIRATPESAAPNNDTGLQDIEFLRSISVIELCILLLMEEGRNITKAIARKRT